MRGFLKGLRGEDGGQVLPIVCVMILGMMSLAAFALDVGHAVYTSRELQATTDADALAAAAAMTRTGSTMMTINGSANATGSGGVVWQYSSVSGGYNARSTLASVSVTSTMKCLRSLQSQGIPCVGTVPYNAIEVTQSSVLNTFFGGIVGVKTLNLSSMSTASTRGGAAKPTNVAVIMDTTLSMNAPDTDCVVNGVTQTQMQCALNGFQVLLQNLSPCGNYQSACASGGLVQNPFDQVALFTFPALTTSTVTTDINCTTPLTTAVTGAVAYPPYGLIIMPPAAPASGLATASTYSFPSAGASSYAPSGSTYQLTGYLADYRTSNSAMALNPNSSLVKAAGGRSGCGSMLPSNYDGVYGTYYAGVIYAAQSTLTAQHVLYPHTDNVIVLLSDGDSTASQNNGSYPVMPSPAGSSGSYPSYMGECGQAITAAKAASEAGTIVYMVGYGSEPTGCASDAHAGTYPGISPCDAMAAMATAPQNFYSDWKQSGSGSTCVSSQPVTSLADIFKAISQDLSEARLIPNGTT